MSHHVTTSQSHIMSQLHNIMPHHSITILKCLSITSQCHNITSKHHVTTSHHSITISRHITASHHNTTSRHNITSQHHNITISRHNITASQHHITTSCHNITTSQHNNITSEHHHIRTSIQFNSIQFNFICIAPNHNIYYLKALYRVRSRPNSSHKEQALDDRGEEKLPFNRKKPLTEPGSEGAAVCLDRLGLGGEKKGRKECVCSVSEQWHCGLTDV